jgi:hypothetical protein
MTGFLLVMPVELHFFVVNLFTCAYIVWIISPTLSFPPPHLPSYILKKGIHLMEEEKKPVA